MARPAQEQRAPAIHIDRANQAEACGPITTQNVGAILGKQATQHGQTAGSGVPEQVLSEPL